MIAATMGATVIGGGYSVGAIGDAYEMGLVWALIATGGYFHFIFSGLWVAPKFRAAKLYTVAGYFGHRYDDRARFLAMVLSLLFSVFIVAAQIAAIGSVLSALMPEDMIEAAVEVGEEFEVLPDENGSQNIMEDSVANGTAGALLNDSTISKPEQGQSISASEQSTGKSAEQKEAEKRHRQKMVQLAIIIGGAIVIIYSTAGGLLAVIHTDVYQFVVLFVGFLLTLGFIAPDVIASWGTFTEDISNDFFRLGGGKGLSFLITTWLAFFLGETFAPGYATRYMIGKTIRDTKIGIAGVGLLLALTFPAVIFFIALYARNMFPGIDSQQALPMVIRELHNPIIGGLMIAALLSAVMSSADSALNSATAIFVKDLFEHHLGWEHKGDKKILKLARIWTVLLGIISIIIAYLWPNIIDLLVFTYHTWAPG
ncbi:sodium:solute symporter family protein, partial [bacterium]|nr:sodium:solute symporter family protein [bacterium]